MNSKYWYTVQNKKGEYLIGYGYGIQESSEERITEVMQEYCQKKNFRLVVLIQTLPGIPIINQVYPFEMDTEVQTVLSQMMAAMGM